MRPSNEEMFTTNWALFYDGWVLTGPNGDWGQIYTRGTCTIHTNRNVFYNVLQVYNQAGKLIADERIYTVPQYLELKKKLKWK